MSDYLPKDATIEQACKWLEARTGETWILARLLACHLTPYFWLDYTPEWPATFDDRIEGYQTKMLFQGDMTRLESDGVDALVNMFAAHDGELTTSTPAMRVPLSDLRFKRECIKEIAEIITSEKQANTEPRAATVMAPVLSVGELPQWKMRIQIEATAHMKRLRASGANPTVHSILDWMVTWCRNNDVKTSGGIYPAAGYLRTHVLAGKHWIPPR